MQPSTRQSGAYWVALPETHDPFHPQTNIMRLNTATMSLDSWGQFTISGIACATDGLWIDESTGFAYCVYKGHVFRIAIPPKAYEPAPWSQHEPTIPEPPDE
jgi:hypothetical protein